MADGEPVRVTSRRGASWRRRASTGRCGPGSSFMTLHFPDEVDANSLTIDATDPKSGTAEFKACAVRVETVRSSRWRGAQSLPRSERGSPFR